MDTNLASIDTTRKENNIPQKLLKGKRRDGHRQGFLLPPILALLALLKASRRTDFRFESQKLQGLVQFCVQMKDWEPNLRSPEIKQGL